MHHDIKNFSQILGIKVNLEIRVTVKIHGTVSGAVTFNGILCNEGTNIFNSMINEDLVLVSEIQDFTEGTSGIEITDFTVNGYNVIPKYQHLSSSGNGYHDWIGRWEMVVPAPFYVWYHAVSGQGWIA